MKKRNEGHFGYPMFEGMPELTDDDTKRGTDWPMIGGGAVITVCVAAALFLAVQIAFASPSKAETPIPYRMSATCYSAEYVERKLSEDHHEVITQIGKMTATQHVLIFQNLATGTATIAFLTTDGLICLAIVAENWEMPGIDGGTGL